MRDQWYEVFAAGDYGDKGRYSEGDLDQIVANWHPENSPAPLVVGHPKNNDPAYGWVSALKREGGKLLAQFSDVAEALVRAVRDKRYRRVSVRIAKKANGWTLRHVGLLGAGAPAVDGLKPVEFGDEDADVFVVERRFQEDEMPEISAEELKRQLRAELEAEFAEKEKALKADIARERLAMRTAELKGWAHEQVEAGRVLPAQADAVVNFCLAVESAEVDFSVEGADSPGGWFRGFVEGLPRRPELSEVAGKGSDPGRSAVDFAAPEGLTVDPERMELHAKATRYAREHNVGYAAALAAVR